MTAPAALTTTTTFTVPGAPQGQRRARAVAIRGRARMHDDPANRVYADRVRWAWREAGAATFEDNPVELTITAYFTRPKNHWTATKGELSAAGGRAPYPTRKPDADNIAKAICDALNGLAWHDDSQVVNVTVSKRWAVRDDPACVTVTAGIAW